MPNHPTSASGVPGCAGVRRFRRRAARPRPRGAPRPAQPDHRARGPPAPRPPAHRRHVARGRPPPAPGRLHRGLPRPARLRPVQQARHHRRPRSVLEARDGGGRARPHAPPRARALRRGRARPGQLRRAAPRARPPARGVRARRARQRAHRRSPRPVHRPVRDRLVALVLLRPARQARTRHPRRPRRLVRRHARAHGRRRVRGVPAGHPRPGDRARDARGLPRRPRARPRPRRGRSGAGRRVACPTLVLWSRHDDLEQLYGDPLRIWADWAEDLRGGHSIESGHHMAEEASGEVAASLLAFLGSVEDDVR